jgi:hypothetical protein
MGQSFWQCSPTATNTLRARYSPTTGDSIYLILFIDFCTGVSNKRHTFIGCHFNKKVDQLRAGNLTDGATTPLVKNNNCRATALHLRLCQLRKNKIRRLFGHLFEGPALLLVFNIAPVPAHRPPENL